MKFKLQKTQFGTKINGIEVKSEKKEESVETLIKSIPSGNLHRKIKNG